MKPRIPLMLAVAMFSCTVQAKLNGKNVLLVHGFHESKSIVTQSQEALSGLASQYWEKYWLANAEVVLHYPMDRRIGEVTNFIKPQIEKLVTDGTCRVNSENDEMDSEAGSGGCVVITHGIGDLVLKHLLSRLGQMGINPDEFSVLAAVDIAGMSGGTELADLTFNVAENTGRIYRRHRVAVEAFTGLVVEGLALENLGLLLDARTVTARGIATENGPIPHLRFAGTGKGPYGRKTERYIKGRGDGVVPLHSACGANYNGKYTSCSRSRRANGKEKMYETNGPGALLFNHYALLIGENVDHFGTISDAPGGSLTPMVGGISIDGVGINFPSYCYERGFWVFWYRRCTIKDTMKSMSHTIYDALNN